MPQSYKLSHYHVSFHIIIILLGVLYKSFNRKHGEWVFGIAKNMKQTREVAPSYSWWHINGVKYDCCVNHLTKNIVFVQNLLLQK